MRTKKLLLLTFVSLFFAGIAAAQTGYIYVHQKNVNEENSVDFDFALKNSSGATTNTWKLNDQATADNVALSGKYPVFNDIGASHGAGGNGQLWGTGYWNLVNTTRNDWAIYYRNPGSSNWIKTSVTLTANMAIDGAYANQAVYGSSNGLSNIVSFYNNGSVVNLAAMPTNVMDVTANNGRIAASGFDGKIYLYSASYTSTTAPSTTGTWTAIVTGPGTARYRIDMNLAGTTIAYMDGTVNTPNIVYTVDFSSSPVITNLGNSSGGGTSATDANTNSNDVAYDDNGRIYATTFYNSAATGSLNLVSYYTGGTSWTRELPSRDCFRLTGGAAGMVWGVQPSSGNSNGTGFFQQGIWFRATDNAGNTYWIDDERLKNASTLAGNGIIIPVTAGTYTVQETLPNTTWDLGRFNIYDPTGNSTGDVKTNIATVNVAANEVVYVEFVNEKLFPQSMTTSCTRFVLESFDQADYGAPTSGSGSVPFEGTSYHFHFRGSGGTSVGDGRYSLEQSFAFWNGTNLASVGDHTGNGGYALLINASYSQDEFFRKRITNLKAGVQYEISFWAIDVSAGSPIRASIYYGMQDTTGLILASQDNSTGSLPQDWAWHKYSYVFTATSATADLFLRNENIGGNGNDLAIDDISLNPIGRTVPPSIVPSPVCVGSTVTSSNTLAGGVWSISPTTVATVNFTSGVVTGVSAGTATVTYSYTNPIGCVTSASSIITVNPKPSVTVSRWQTGNVCSNEADSLFAVATGGTVPYTYLWTASPATNAGLGTNNIARTTAKPAAAGTYTYTNTVTDANGCIATGNVAITATTDVAPNLSVTTSGNLCSGPFTLQATTARSGPAYTYQWSAAPTGNGLTGTPTTSNVSVTPTAAGTYVYTVQITTNSGLCVVPIATPITFGALTVSASNFSNALCNNTVDTVYSTVTGGSTPYTYSWGAASPVTSPILTIVSPNTASSAVTGGLLSSRPTNYTIPLTVTDSRGCTGTANAAISRVNANGPTVSLANGTMCANTTKNLVATVAAGAGAISSYTWSAAPSANAGLNNPATSPLTNSINVTPTAGGSYKYNLKVSDANNCAIDANSTQTVAAAPSVTLAPARTAFCTGTDSMQLTAVATGGSGVYSSYAWSVVSGSGTTLNPTSSTTSNTTIATITGATPGSSTFRYGVTVTDNAGCTGTANSPILAVANKPTVSANATIPSSCYSSGSAFTLTGSFSGGASPYNYIWSASTGATVAVPTGTTSPANTTASITGAGVYAFTLAVTDNNGCIGTATSPITEVYGSLSVSLSADKASVCQSPATAINLTGYLATPTTSPYTYAWSGSGVVNANSITTTATPTATGNYTLTVTDGNGCTGSATTPSSVYVDPATPSIVFSCSTNSNGQPYGTFNELNGTSWLWTSSTGAKFYSSPLLGINNDASTSTSQVTYIAQKGTYNVAITNSAGCNGNINYVVNALSCSVVLAESKINLTAAKQNNTALLAWTITNGTAAGYFVVERSSDGRQWTEIASVAGTSIVNGKYSYTDAAPLSGANYYRVKAFNNGQQAVTSETRQVSFGDVWVVKLYPNPARNFAVLEFNSSAEEKAEISLLTSQGNVVLVTEKLISKGANRITLDGLSPLAQGVYIIKMVTASQVYKTKLIKGN